MKLIIQIPCYNEESTLPGTYRDLPKQIGGIDEIETLVIDDGSTDRTVEAARNLGVDHIVKFPNNRGLAHAFKAGLDACLRLGADIIVNTDGDNQYDAADIPALVAPILEGQAEIVIGDRQIDTIKHFSNTKKRFQKIGSGIVRKASQTIIEDTTSGFRAYSRDAAMKINVISDYTYTLETIIDAGLKKMSIKDVKIHTNEKLRESRLFTNMFGYVRKSAGTIVRTYVSKSPLKAFLPIAFIIFLAGLAIAIRYLYFYSIGEGGGHVQSLLLAAILFISAFLMAMFALLADTLSASRKVSDEILYRIKKMEYDLLNKNGKNAKKQ